MPCLMFILWNGESLRESVGHVMFGLIWFGLVWFGLVWAEVWFMM